MCKIFKNIFFVLIASFSLCISYSSSAQYHLKPGEEKIVRALQVVRGAYVDTVYEDKLVERMIVYMLKQLDPFSVYLNEEQIKRVNEPLKGKFVGIGVQFEKYRDSILVNYVIPGSPARKAGLIAGDKIVTVNGKKFSGKDFTVKQAQKELRGKENTEVKLEIARVGNIDLLPFTIKRGSVAVESVEAYYMLDTATAYIKINRFTRNTISGYHKAFDSLQKMGMKQLVLDLRGNNGGYLDVALEFVDEFLEDDKLIVYTEGLHSHPVYFKAKAGGNFEKGRLAVLVNESTASVSEIVAGALQDWDRALLLGRRTFGKGLIQKQFKMPDETEIRLTVARYYTPSGRSIQRVNNKTYWNNINKFVRNYPNDTYFTPEGMDIPDSLFYFTSGNRLVSGGGGVIPDFNIPWEKERISEFYSELSKNNIIRHFALKYINENRKILPSAFKDFSDFNRSFRVDDSLLQGLIDYAIEEGVPKDKKGLKVSEPYMRVDLKANIAKALFNNAAYIESFGSIDPAIKKASQMINDDAFYKEKGIF